MKLTDRFWSKVDKTDTCWLWNAGKNHYGYGSYRIMREDGTSFAAQAHRLSYESLVGEIPDGLVVDHLCRNPACVNPDHMEVVTRGENVLRGTGTSARHRRLTHCKHGHPFDEDNTYRPPATPHRRQCKTCTKRRNAMYASRARR